MCLSQLHLPRSEIAVFNDCKIEFRYELLPKQSPKTEKDRLWNEKLKRLCENENKHTITILVAAGTYDTEIIIDLINQAIQDNEVQCAVQELKTGKCIDPMGLTREGIGLINSKRSGIFKHSGLIVYHKAEGLMEGVGKS